MSTTSVFATDARARFSIDPVTFEVLSSAFGSVVEEMGLMLERVAVSTVVSEGRDFSGGLCTADGDVVARGTGDLPLIGGTASFRVKAIISSIPRGDVHEGDIFLHNDPFLGGTHAQDVSAAMPVFWQGDLIAFVHTAAHWPDIGGPLPGSFNSQARSTFEEALLIPPIHIVRCGELDREVERFILRNVRIPEVIGGDLRAQIEACRTGEQRMHHLGKKYGRALILEEMSSLILYAEDLLRAEFARLPDGTFSWTDYIDRDPASESPDPLPVGLDITIRGDTATYDFSRCAPQAMGPVNAPVSSTCSAAIAGTKQIFPHIPLNSGMLHALTFVIPERTVVSAEYPAPVSGQAASPAEKIISCVHGCYIQVLPERCMACPTNMANICLGGVDPRLERNSDYVMYFWLGGGWGGRPGRKDNGQWLMTLASGSCLQTTETLERVYPVIFGGVGLVPDSEGAGYHRGGFALRSPFWVTDGRAILNAQGDRGRVAGWGFEGGWPASLSHLVYAPGTEEEFDIGMMRAGVEVQARSVIDFQQCGGGGWGDPYDRPAEWVLEDVMNELVSVERARDIYGVVLGVGDIEALEYGIDFEATARLRASRGEGGV